ncbi:MAG: LptE family protein, partial [Bacteroidales bacterium]|nr:LptE family protein [Bacteroidales bacterium]
ASIPPAAKTFSIAYFKNNASLVEPTMAPVLTDALINRMLNQTRLAQVDLNGDLDFQGIITAYQPSQPISVVDQETTAQNRMTITVKVTFVNKVDEKLNFEKSFSRYMDYSSDLDVSSIQDQYISEIAELLVEDIYNEAVANW